MKHAFLILTLAFAPSLLAAQSAQPGQVVGPACTYTGSTACRGTITGQGYGQDVTSPSGQQRDWWADRQGAFAEVTTTNPREGYGGYDQGSLELRVAGQNASPGSDEWGFWYRFAGGASYENARSANYGNLTDLTSLSFDWFREGNAQSMLTNPSEDWPYKTPVLRLRLLETDEQGAQYESELVWEGWFNRDTEFGGGTTPLNTWVTSSNMQTDKFWYGRLPGSPGTSLISSGQSCGLIPQVGWSGGITAFTLGQYTGGNAPCIRENTVVTGIAVGIGSRWPLPYTGFVDNVRMGFGGVEVLNTNFDFIPGTTVPEPSTWAMMGAGLIALGVAARRRNRR